jgi:hypothetical protein
MAVKMWTLFRDTCRESSKSGWCFAGINNSCTLFMNLEDERKWKTGQGI